MKDAAGARLLANAQALARSARRAARAGLAGHGLGDQRTSLIAYLYRQGPTGLPEIADSLDLHRAATAALLARMEADGLVAWEPCPSEPGGRYALAARGVALIQPVRAEILRIRAEALRGLAPEEIEAANGTLRRMIANLQR